jgi:hypothetical protein
MSGGASRPLVGFLGAISIALLPFTVQPLQAAASTSSGTLFAITGSQALVKVDPSTGGFTQLTDLNTPKSPQSNALAGDPTTHRLFTVRTTVTFSPNGPIFTEELLTINGQTGVIVSNPQISGRPPQDLVFDTSTGTLYGFTGLAIVRIDPASASMSTVATISNGSGAFIFSLALDSQSHTVYVSREDVSGPVGTNTPHVLSVNTQTGTFTTGPVLTQPVRQIAIDSGKLFGITDCCSFNFVGINPSTGATNFIASVGGSIIQFGMTTDPTSHTIFVDIENQEPPGSSVFKDHIVSINDVTGQSAVSADLPDSVVTLGLAFEPAIMVTPESIEADVRSAFASGAITNAGVAISLLLKLDVAEAARSLGHCSTAAKAYAAFIRELSAQSGKTVAPATANQLTSEAQFLITNCP